MPVIQCMLDSFLQKQRITFFSPAPNKRIEGWSMEEKQISLPLGSLIHTQLNVVFFGSALL